MQTKTVNLFLVDELSEEAKRNAIELYRGCNTYGEWADHIIEEAHQTILALGYEGVEVLWSGFGSQGDGACFTGSVLLKDWLEKHRLSANYLGGFALLSEYAGDITIKITHQGRFSHENSTTVDASIVRDEVPDGLEAELEKVVTLITEEKIKLGKAIYKTLEEEYFYQQEDERVIETLKASEVLFTVNGNIPVIH